MKISSVGFAILRTPLFPLNREIETCNPIFKEALYVSSPSLYDSIQTRRDVNISLDKYKKRASFRCTPYGLFAGLSRIGINENPVILENQIKYTRRCKIDQLFFYEILQSLDDFLLRRTYFKPNNTIYRRENELRFIEYSTINKIRNYNLVRVDAIPEIEILLKRSKKGEGMKFDELVRILTKQNVDEEEASDFIKQLISSKILIGEFELSHTDHNGLEGLLDKLIPYSQNKEVKIYYDELKRLNNKIKSLNEIPLGSGLSTYLEIKDISKKFSRSLPEGMLCNSELYKPTVKGGISQKIIDECIKSVIFLSQITKRKQNDLENFKEDFNARYGDQFIPLMEVIDDDVGLGYPITRGRNIKKSHFLDGIKLPENPDDTSHAIDNWSSFLMNLVERASKKEIEVLDLSRVVFDNKANHTDPIEFDFSAAINIYASSQSNSLIRLIGCYGPSSLNHLLRFRGNIVTDEDIESIINEEDQKYEDIILAEIVHIPHPRVANILKKGRTYKYEIPIVSKPLAKKDNTIPLSDLYVGIVEERIVLFSKKNQKEVIPRQSSSHNYGFNSIPVYRFLCDLKDQRFEKSLSWDWGALENFEYLPRVKYNNTILARRRWKFSFISLKETQIENFLRERLRLYNVPRNLLIINDDQELPINLENDFDLMINEIRKHKEIRLEENLFTEFGTFVKNKNGDHFTNEVVLPFAVSDAKIQSIKNKPALNDEIPSTYQPGSEWYYFKIYCSESFSDSLLEELIRPWVNELCTGKKIYKFFFIRYADPAYHIRIRFLTNNTDFVKEMYLLLAEPIRNRSISKIQVDTYNRELNRYGKRNIEKCESIFHYDRLAVLEIAKENLDQEKWKHAIKGIDEYLRNFQISIEEKVKLMRILSNGYLEEFRADKKTKASLSKKFRNLRNDLKAILEKDHDFHAILNRSTYIQEYIDSMDFEESNKFDLVASLIHMFLNRLFSSQQRFHELVIYDLLFKHYNSLFAQIKNASNKK